MVHHSVLTPQETAWGRRGSFVIPFTPSVSVKPAVASVCVFSSGLCSTAVFVTEHQRRKGLAAVLSRASENRYIGKFLFLT